MVAQAMDPFRMVPSEDELRVVAEEVASEFGLRVEEVLGETVLREEAIIRWRGRETEKRLAEKKAREAAIARARAEIIARRGNKVLPPDQIAPVIKALQDHFRGVDQPSKPEPSKPEIPDAVQELKVKYGKLFPEVVFMDWVMASLLRGWFVTWLRQCQGILSKMQAKQDQDHVLMARIQAHEQKIRALEAPINEVIRAWGHDPKEDKGAHLRRIDGQAECPGSPVYWVTQIPGPETAAEKAAREEREAKKLLESTLVIELETRLSDKGGQIAEVAAKMASRVFRKFFGPRCDTASDMLVAAAMDKIREVGADDPTAKIYAQAAGIGDEEWGKIVFSILNEKKIAAEEAERQRMLAEHARRERQIQEAERRAHDPSYGAARKDAPTSKKGQDSNKKKGGKGKGRK